MTVVESLLDAQCKNSCMAVAPTSECFHRNMEEIWGPGMLAEKDLIISLAKGYYNMDLIEYNHILLSITIYVLLYIHLLMPSFV